MRKLIYKLYINFLIIGVRIRYFLLGFENVNNRIQTIDKNVICKILKIYGAQIDDTTEIESPIYINAKNNYNNLRIDKNVYIGKACLLDLKGEIWIGENTTISMQSTLISHTDLGIHCILNKNYPASYSKCIIGKNCYLGARSLILPNVQLSDMTVVAAGSVVTSSTNASTIVAGAPAKAVKNIY